MSTADLSPTSLSDCIFGPRKVMVVSPLVLLLMPMRVTGNFVLRQCAKCNILPRSPVDGCTLAGAQLTVHIDEKALEGA